MINYCKAADNVELVAVCDKWEEGLSLHKEMCEGQNITYYNNFDDVGVKSPIIVP